MTQMIKNVPTHPMKINAFLSLDVKLGGRQNLLSFNFKIFEVDLLKKLAKLLLLLASRKLSFLNFNALPRRIMLKFKTVEFRLADKDNNFANFFQKFTSKVFKLSRTNVMQRSLQNRATRRKFHRGYVAAISCSKTCQFS